MQPPMIISVSAIHMGFQPPEFKQPLSTCTPPKLSLYSLPSKPPTLPDRLTPPLNTVAAVPFLWEEAPGKPRPTHDDPPKSKAVRSLDLPPRLTALVNNEIIPSPTTVLSGSYVLGSPEKGKSKGKMRMPLRKLMRSPEKFTSSWRWDADGVHERSPSLNFCSWRWDSFRDIGGGASNKSASNIGKVKRKNSFTFAADDATNTSSFLVSLKPSNLFSKFSHL